MNRFENIDIDDLAEPLIIPVAADVHHHRLESARRDDAARGVEWPVITDKQMSDDLDKRIYEAIALDRFPAGQAPQTEWTFLPQDPEKWPYVIGQDISNMIEVQKGMKSRGFPGVLPNPWQERKVSNLHRNLAEYMETGAPQRLK